jgi:hypothetical protein
MSHDDKKRLATNEIAKALAHTLGGLHVQLQTKFRLDHKAINAAILSALLNNAAAMVAAVCVAPESAAGQLGRKLTAEVNAFITEHRGDEL